MCAAYSCASRHGWMLVTLSRPNKHYANVNMSGVARTQSYKRVATCGPIYKLIQFANCYENYATLTDTVICRQLPRDGKTASVSAVR